MTDTKTAALIRLLRRQWVTPIDALNHCKLMSLAQRVSELRARGYVIADRWIDMPGSRFKAYRLVRAPNLTGSQR